LHRHHDEQVDVAVRAGVAPCMRAEENDLFRSKPIGDPLRHLADHWRQLG